MEKVARLVSVEFNSAEEKKQTLEIYRSRLAEFAPGVELVITVNTGETEVMAIQVYPDGATLERTKNSEQKFLTEFGAKAIRDRIEYEGDVDFWFQQIKYFGAAAIEVSGAGA